MTARRALLGAGLALALTSWAGEVSSQAVEVPIRLQAELLAKVAAYDRAFLSRAQGRALVFVVVRPGDAESERLGEQLLAELGALEQIGGLPHAEERVRYSSARELAELCKGRGPAIVYFSVGLLEQMDAIAEALSGVSTLSVAVTSAYVQKRAVLGFDAQSSRPKLVVHLGQARKQRVAFKPELLALARVLQ